MLQALIGPVVGLVKGWQDGRREKAEAKAEMDKILTQAAASSEEVAAKIALARVEGDKDTWKDELGLLTIILPYWVAMFCAIFGVDPVIVQEMFANMAAIPEYWQETFQYAIWAVLGIVGVKRVLK